MMISGVAGSLVLIRKSYPIPIPRFLDTSNDTDPPRIRPATDCPSLRSSIGRQGPRLNARSFSMTATLPLTSRSGRR